MNLLGNDKVQARMRKCLERHLAGLFQLEGKKEIVVKDLNWL